MSNSKEMSTVVSGDLVKRIDGNKIKFFLLYKATEKVDVDEFHSKCNAKGATVTLLTGAYNTLFGAYTSTSWSSPSKQRKVKDENAFIFSKENHVDAKCFFLPIKKDKADIAILCDRNYGPTFGANAIGGYDLQTFKLGKNPGSEFKDGLLYLNGSININNAYAVERKVRGKDDPDTASADKPKIKSKDINSGRMIVKSLEVYQVIDCGENWLDVPGGDEYEEIRQDLVNMVPLPGLNIDHYNILLLGTVAAGKSSFINTLSTLFSRNVVQIAPARQEATSVTSKLKPYQIKTEKGDTIKISMYDIRGYEVKRGYKKELELLLEGRPPIGYRFPEEEAEVDIDLEEVANPSLNDKIHIVCMVEGQSHFEEHTEELLKKIGYMKKIIANTGIPLVVVATKFDQLCPNIEANTEHLFKSSKAKDAVARIAEFYGVHRKQVFPVVNYRDEKEPVQAKDQLALSAIYEISKLIEGHWTHDKHNRDIPDPWRQRQDMLPNMGNDDEKRKAFRSVAVKLTQLGKKILRALVVGPIDSGKSSFIDSIASTLCQDLVINIGNIGRDEENGTSTTEKLNCMNYVADGTERRKSTVFLGDTPGFQEVDGITKEQIKFIINGNVPDRYKIINGIQETQKDFKKEPTPEDKIHCVCLVFDCENIQKGLSAPIITSMKDVLRVVSSQECPFMVVLTMCDKVSGSIKAGRIRVFEDTKVRDCKDNLITMFGFKQPQIFPVVNYIEDNFVDPQKDALLLAAFNNILKIGEKRLQEIEIEVGSD